MQHLVCIVQDGFFLHMNMFSRSVGPSTWSPIVTDSVAMPHACSRDAATWASRAFHAHAGCTCGNHNNTHIHRQSLGDTATACCVACEQTAPQQALLALNSASNAILDGTNNRATSTPLLQLHKMIQDTVAAIQPASPPAQLVAAWCLTGAGGGGPGPP